MPDEPKLPELPAAMLAAQSEMRAIKKDSTNPHFGSGFLSLAGTIEAVRPLYNKHGIAIIQDVTTEDGFLCCYTTLVHKGGEAMRFGPLRIALPPNASAQVIGSAISYARRYHGQAVFFIAAEDDDGEKASKPQGVELPRLSSVAQAKPVASPAAASEDNLAAVVTAADWKGRVGKGPYKVSTPEGEFSSFDEPLMRSIKAGVLVVYKKTRFGLDVVKVEGSAPEGKDDDLSVPF